MADKFNFDGAEEMTVEQKERMEKNAEFEKSMDGKYSVVLELCGPESLVDIFDNLEDALERAAELWGGEYIWIRMPDGSHYNFPKNWYMSAKINIIRLRQGQLNPKQEYLLTLWKRYFPTIKLENYTCLPSDLWEQVKDCGEAIQKLYIDSFDWGLFEIVDWINGYDMATHETIDRKLSLGSTRSV